MADINLTNQDDEFASGATSDVISAFNGDDLVRTGAGNDIIFGMIGDDILIAESGDNELYGGQDSDILMNGTGRDRLDGGSGVDLASFEHSTAGVDAYLNLGRATVGLDTSSEQPADTLVSIENLFGSGFKDTLSGNGLDNQIWGHFGHDDLFGGDGDDYLSGGDGDDTLSGGNDDDVLRGGDGNDTFISGSGDDVIITGSNRDEIVFDDGDGHDRVTDFSIADVINLEKHSGAANWTSVEDVIANGNTFGGDFTFQVGEDTLRLEDFAPHVDLLTDANFVF